jgi:hypothetical protein
MRWQRQPVAAGNRLAHLELLEHAIEDGLIGAPEDFFAGLFSR